MPLLCLKYLRWCHCRWLGSPPPFSSNTWGNYLVLKNSHFWQFDEAWICGCLDPGDRKLIPYQLVHYGRSEPTLIFSGREFFPSFTLSLRHDILSVRWLLTMTAKPSCTAGPIFSFKFNFWAISSKALLGSPLPVVVSYITATNYLSTSLSKSELLGCSFGPALDWSCAFSCTTTCSVWVWSFTMFSFIFVVQ